MREFLRRFGMIGQIDPWRVDDEGRPIIALLVPVESALLEYNEWAGTDLTRTAFVSALKDDDVFVFRNIDEFVKLKEQNRNIEKTIKNNKKSFKREVSEDQKKILRDRMKKINEAKKGSIPKNPQ